MAENCCFGPLTPLEALPFGCSGCGWVAFFLPRNVEIYQQKLGDYTMKNGVLTRKRCGFKNGDVAGYLMDFQRAIDLQGRDKHVACRVLPFAWNFCFCHVSLPEGHVKKTTAWLFWADAHPFVRLWKENNLLVLWRGIDQHFKPPDLEIFFGPLSETHRVLQTWHDLTHTQGVHKSQGCHSKVNEHSYWKLPFIVDFPIKNGDFP